MHGFFSPAAGGHAFVERVPTGMTIQRANRTSMGNADYLTQYASACGALATDYVVRILDARPHVYPFSVTIRHALEVAWEAVLTAGRLERSNARIAMA